MDSTPLRSGQTQIEPTQSLAISPPGIPLTEDEGFHAQSHLAEPSQATRAEGPTAREKLATGSSRDELTSDERPGSAPRRRRRHTTRSPEARVGRTLGQYKLLELIGRGGMGCVYRAEHIKLGRQVALKLLRATHAERRDAVARFFQEARAVNRIRHRNIVDVTDFVELDDGTTFIIMELLEGASLRRLMRAATPRGLEEPRILAILIQICDALTAAHDEGIIHRDLKPDNVFVVPMGDGGELIKLLDFGVAKLLHRDDTDDNFAFETAAGTVIGTPAYMSPEQAGGLAVDARSDIYSLGAIMYELFTGRPPFRGKSFGEFVRKHLTDLPIPPSQTSGGKHIPAELEEMVLRCLEKQPDNRYTDVLELKTELVQMLAAAPTGISISSDSDIVAAHTSLSQTCLPITQASKTPMAIGELAAHSTHTQERASRRLILGIAGIACVAAVAIVFVVSRSGSSVAASSKQKRLTRNANQTAKTQADTSDPAPNPHVGPIRRNTRDVREDLLTIHFDSTPKALVYRSNKPTSICETPCNVTINTLNGGSTTSRNFLLRAKGYRDKPVVIDLKNAPHRRYIRLSPLHPTPLWRDLGATPPTTRSNTSANKHKPRDSSSTSTVKSKRNSTTPKVGNKRPDSIDPTTTIDPFSRK